MIAHYIMTNSILTPEECLDYLREYKEEPPDFIQKNGAWLLTVIGVGAGCLGTIFTYFLKSRCKKLRFACLECDRSPINLDMENAVVTTSSTTD